MRYEWFLFLFWIAVEFEKNQKWIPLRKAKTAKVLKLALVTCWCFWNSDEHFIVAMITTDIHNFHILLSVNGKALIMEDVDLYSYGGSRW
jgi:hypothetical protein